MTFPRYIDLRVGDSIRATRADGTVVGIVVASVEVESGSHLCPRTRVNLQAEDRAFSVQCGMVARDRGGIGPIEIDGVLVGCEVTRLLFSGMKGGSSPFNTYERLQLRHDLRLALWDSAVGVMPGADGRFVVRQPRWTGERFANWLHSTGYGIHSAIDIFATPDIPPEEVCSPIDGTVGQVYNRNLSPEDARRSKAINIYGDAVVGPDGEKVLYRFQHLSEIVVSNGEPVSAGQIIGLTGHTGFDPELGDHLHFEIRLNPSHFGRPFDDDIFATVPVNPYNFLLEWRDGEGRE